MLRHEISATFRNKKGSTWKTKLKNLKQTVRTNLFETYKGKR